MTDPLPIQGIRPQSEAAPASKAAATDGGPQFRALLDRLQAETRGLQATSETLSDPKDLGSAVDQARNALDEARSLGDQLLEAYRAARHVAGAKGNES